MECIPRSKECIASEIEDQLSELIKKACRQRWERGASIVPLTDMINTAILESTGYDMRQGQWCDAEQMHRWYR
jgi:hypothetical protein